MKGKTHNRDSYTQYLDRRIEMKDIMRGTIAATECARVKVLEAINGIYVEENTPIDPFFRDHLDEALAAINEMQFGLVSIASRLGIAGLYAIKITPPSTAHEADL